MRRQERACSEKENKSLNTGTHSKGLHAGKAGWCLSYGYFGEVSFESEGYGKL